jgi:hypothetical protein
MQSLRNPPITGAIQTKEQSTDGVNAKAPRTSLDALIFDDVLYTQSWCFDSTAPKVAISQINALHLIEWRSAGIYRQPVKKQEILMLASCCWLWFVSLWSGFTREVYDRLPDAKDPNGSVWNALSLIRFPSVWNFSAGPLMNRYCSKSRLLTNMERNTGGLQKGLGRSRGSHKKKSCRLRREIALALETRKVEV